jgi:ABC-type nitrate/sulfonate/bicarbonate transport system substrate-binding protein
MVRKSFAEQYPEEHVRLIAALIEACVYCDNPANRESVVELLARPEYVNAPAECLRQSLIGPFNYGNGRIKPVPEFHVFNRHGANEPSADKAAWVLRQLANLGAIKNNPLQPQAAAANVFRPDIFEQALQLVNERKSPETKPAPDANLSSA